MSGPCHRGRAEKAETSEGAASFTGSRVMPAKEYGKTLRDRWPIENGLRRQADVTPGGGAGRVRQRAEAANFPLPREVPLPMLGENPRRVGIAVKRYMAGLDPDCRAEILAGSQDLEKR